MQFKVDFDISKFLIIITGLLITTFGIVRLIIDFPVSILEIDELIIFMLVFGPLIIGFGLTIQNPINAKKELRICDKKNRCRKIDI